MKNLANVITVTRLIGTVILLFTEPFSLLFWILYLYCGVGDFVDGLIARGMKQQSALGAKLDSVADLAFFLVIVITVVPVLVVPLWIWEFAIAAALIRGAAYLIGYKKYHTFSALHTYANKATGGLLFGSPVLYVAFGITVTGVILCSLAALSACEELLITVLSKKLDRNCRSIFLR